MDIIKTLEKYNLTLRHYPDKVVSYIEDREQDLKENEERVICGKWKDGSDRKMIKQTYYRNFPAWTCYVTKNWYFIESWTKHFNADSPEEAVKLAVEFIESKNHERISKAGGSVR